ncbi:MAG TPA: ATP-grasp domain-containing protein [Ignavibacteriaceae bacterium]|nr:ATP-grasp domain-containing protein [Ignavibacteriaceae bacterium]
MFTENSLVPAVILSTHLMGYGVIRSLGRMNVPIIAVYYEKKDMGYVSKYVKEKYFTPHAEYQEDAFIKALIDINKSGTKYVLFPADDASLNAVSKNKKLLENNYIVGCSDWDVTQKYIEKQYTYTIAEKLGINVPRTLQLNDVDDFTKLNLNFPVLVKPSKSHEYYNAFGKKMEVVNNYSELESAYKKAKDNGHEVMIQEIILGPQENGINYNSLIINKKIVLDFTAKKIRYTPTPYGVPCSAVSIEPIPELKGIAEKILNEMNFEGYSCIEFKKDERDGKYKLLEINGRFNRSIIHTVGAGLNFPWIYYNYLLNKKLLDVKQSYVKDLYWIDESHDPIMCLKLLKESSFSQLVNPYKGRHVYANFDVKDMKPFFKRITDLFNLLKQK